MSDTHRCCVPGCDVIISKEYEFCRGHWAKVSQPTRSEWYRASINFNRGDISEALYASVCDKVKKEAKG